MKSKLFLLFVASIFAMNVFAQTDGARERLEASVKEQNDVLPISVQQGLVFTQTYVCENSVCEIQEVDEDYLSFALLSQQYDALKKALLKQYSTTPALIPFASLVVECNMDIVVRFVSKQSGKSFTITLSNKEIAKSII